MKLVDANVLLYAVNRDADRHDEARTWLDAALSGGATVGFAWVVVLGFVRIATKPSIFPTPLPMPEALDRVDAWLEQPPSVLVEPTVRHLGLLRQLTADGHVRGDLVTDAHLAALAIEHRAEVVTYDSDFERFGVPSARPTV